MYGLPPDFDPTIFVGKELIQVSFSANTVFFDFDNGLAVNLQSCLRLRHGSTTGWQLLEVSIESSDLMRLIGHSVVSSTGSSDGTLSMEFDHGATLEFLDPTPQYEAYHIHLGDYIIYV